MRTLRRVVTNTFAGVALAALAGCGGGGGNTTYPVSGKVVFADGKPVTAGLITFESTDTKNGWSAAGPIASDGSFEIWSTEKKAGAKPGKYRVIITPPEGEEAAEMVEGEGEGGGEGATLPTASPASSIDPKFQTVETTSLEAEVKPESNTFTFTVEHPAKTGKPSKKRG